MGSKSVAKSDFASAQLVARTDGRTNGRITHLKEIPHVLNRAQDFEPADIAFTLFLDGFDPAQFSDVEFRMYRQACLRRVA